MIKAGQIAEILSLYRKHGWILRRVLLSDALKNSLTDSLENLFGAAEIRSSEIDAAWFSRAANAGQETWELRRLSETPYALIEFFDAEDEEEIREETLREVESRLQNIGKS
ncbi:MAG TPA: hypothetical protein VNB22_09395 [Pyrinomonadaceae bacterium]|nr:hypothetical protein [Pyrinomonadaceae bacterium]